MNSLIPIALAGVGLIYVGLLALGMGMYFLNARQTDQPCWEFPKRRDELFFHFVAIPFVVGPILAVLELSFLFLGAIFALCSRISSRQPA